MIVIVAGSRSATRADVFAALQQCSWIGFASAFVSGTARGADKFGEEWAEEHGVPIVPLAAEWEKHGRRAGPLRNQEMVNSAEGLVAIWDGHSPGTRSVIDFAKIRGLRIFVYLTKTDAHIDIAPTGELAGAWEDAEERAAMFEFSAGMGRTESERAAGAAYKPKRA